MRWYGVLAMAGWMALTAHAQTPVDPATALQQYQEMKLHAQAGDPVDLRAFRVAAANAGLRKGHRDRYRQAQVALQDEVSGDLRKALDAAQSLIDDNYADPQGHFWKQIILTKMQRPVEAEQEQTLYRAMLASISASGDGKTQATALFVVDADEEAFYNDVLLGEHPVQHALQQQGSTWFDEEKGVDWSGATHTNWFQLMIGPEQKPAVN